jgi:hypothetical protein
MNKTLSADFKWLLNFQKRALDYFQKQHNSVALAAHPFRQNVRKIGVADSKIWMFGNSASWKLENELQKEIESFGKTSLQ